MAKLQVGITLEEYNKALGERIFKLRKDRTGLSAEDFSIKIDVARHLYRDYERGKRNFTNETFIKIINGLGVTVEEFFSEGF